MYIIKPRTDQGGGYVAPEGSEHSYVQDAMKARRFTTREEAEKERCENEIIIDLNRP